jgi:hypothetical protein
MTLHQLLVLCVINREGIDDILYERTLILERWYRQQSLCVKGLILLLHQIERKRHTPDTSSHVVAEMKKENFFCLSRYLGFATMNTFMAAME